MIADELEISKEVLSSVLSRFQVPEEEIESSAHEVRSEDGETPWGRGPDEAPAGGTAAAASGIVSDRGPVDR